MNAGVEVGIARATVSTVARNTRRSTVGSYVGARVGVMGTAGTFPALVAFRVLGATQATKLNTIAPSDKPTFNLFIATTFS